MAEAVNTASSLVIRELTGQQRTVRLVGRALPYRETGFGLKTTQRSEVTWLPGSPEGTLTVLGAEEEPTVINGMWKDKFLSEQENVGVQSALGVSQATTNPMVVNGSPVESAVEAERLFDSICREGQVIDVTWNEVSRRGIIKTFSRDWYNIRDLAWEIRFEWFSRGEGLPPSVFGQETSVGDTASVLRRQSDELVKEAQPTFPVSGEFAKSLGNTLQTVVSSVLQVQGAAAGLARTSLAPAEASRRTVAACTGLIEQAQVITDTMNAQVYYAIDQSQPVESMPLGQRLRAASYARTLIDGANEMKRTAVLRRSTLLSTLDDTLLAVYTAREGEDLRDVSNRFYGTVFEWRRLLVFNLLTTPELSAGQIVMVPKIENGGRRS